MTLNYRIEPLAEHDRSKFCSGEPALDRYFQTGARQDLRRKFTSAFVAVEEAGGDPVGFYTLSATSVLLDKLPADLAAKLPRYPLVPAVLIGRLAVDRECQGRGLGGELLFDALLRVLTSDIGVYAAVVHPKNERARAFYARHGFQKLPETEQMFLPLATVSAII